MGKKILITGGMKSGKSRYALALAKKLDGPKIFLATAEPFDDEMRKKIRYHQKERKKKFLTIEEPLYLAKALHKLESSPGIIIIDCLTVWMNNLFYHFKDGEAQRQAQVEQFLKILKKASSTVIMVTNEIGMSIIPDNALARDFSEQMGFFNQRVVEVCDEVVLMVSGIACKIKGYGRKI